MMSVLSMEVILGALTFTGSLMAAGKTAGSVAAAPAYLQGPKRSQPLVASPVRGGCRLSGNPPWRAAAFPVHARHPLLFGVLMIVPYRRRGHAHSHFACSTPTPAFRRRHGDFVLDSKLLIVAGALDGSSGLHPLRHHVEGHEPVLRPTFCSEPSAR